jgi:MFS superfamily sulfate permease-like transporter
MQRQHGELTTPQPFSEGFLFFGTITHVEETIRSLIEDPYWQQRPVQFLVLDLSLVAGINMSSAEAFVRTDFSMPDS